MTKTILLNRRSLLPKLFMLLMLLVGGGISLSAQKTLPYEYGFENNDLAGEGWTVENGYNYGTSNYARTDISNSANKTGSYGFRFYAYSGYNNQILISPELTAAAVDVSFYYKSTSTSAAQEFYVGYSTTNSESISWGEKISYKETTWKEYQTTFPSGTKYIAIKYISDTQYTNFYIDDISVSVSNPYKIPTDFALDLFAENSATFSWTAGNNETAWQFAYSTTSSFTPGTDGTTLDITTSNLVDGKYTLTGLTEGTTYYAAIRANYGGGHYSEWTDKVSFTPSDIVEETVNDGATSSQYLPINYYGVEPNSGELYKSQFIIPKGSLDFAKERQITKLVFYASAASFSFGNAEFEVYLKETDNSSFSSNAFESWGTCVVNSSKLSINSDKEMIIDLNTPFNYSGNKNLMIGFKQTVKGTKPSYFTWTAVSATNAGYYYYGSSGSRNSYLPKVTITTVSTNTAPVQIGSTGFTTFASSYPLDFTSPIDGLTAYYVASGDVDAEKAKLTEVTSKVSAGTGLVLKGTAGTTYYIPVAASGSDLSGNLMVGCTSETVLTTSASKYVLVNNSGTPEFQDLSENGATIPAGKAYLNATGAGSRLSIVFDDPVVTDVAVSKVAERSSNGIVYNLMGQKVVKPSNGLYVINGKKVIKK